MNRREMLIEELKQWIPRSYPDDAHRGVWHSPNHRIYLRFGGSIYRFHLTLGPFGVSWDAK